MKRLFLSAFLLVMGLSFSQDAKACTDLIVGRKASTDGSVIVSYAADSHTLYGALYHWPAAVWQQGAMLKVYEWDTGVYGGDIAQVGRTYNVVGNMNEKQVAITESTFGGREDTEQTQWRYRVTMGAQIGVTHPQGKKYQGFLVTPEA